MATDKVRWAPIGALWVNGKGEMSGNISLGLLGEVKIYVRPSRVTTAGAPAYNIIAKAEDLPLNKLGSFVGRSEPEQPVAAPELCADVHPQRPDCRCTLVYGHQDSHKGQTTTGEQKTWTNNTSDIPF